MNDLKAFTREQWAYIAIVIAGAAFIGYDYGRRSTLQKLKRKFDEAKDARPTAPPGGDSVG